MLSLILTVAPASGTLFVPDEPPGAKANSFVIVPWRTRWGDGAGLATTIDLVAVSVAPWSSVTVRLTV